MRVEEKNKESDAGQLGALSPDEYQRMNDKEKDAAIERSIIRLQTKIRNILYLAEMEKKKEKERLRELEAAQEKNKGKPKE